MDTSQSISSVLPPPPLHEELRQLWSYNRQHQFTTNRSPFGRPDHHHQGNHRQVHNHRQVPTHRPDLNLRPDLNHHLRQALYPTPFPRH